MLTMTLNDQTLYIKGTINNKQIEQLCSPLGFGEEGSDFSALEIAYFAYLHEYFTNKRIPPAKFHAPFEDSANTLNHEGQEYRLKDRSFFWDGHRLYLLSQSRNNFSAGSYSLFRRAMMIPENSNEDLAFFAMITPFIPDDYTDEEKQSDLTGATRDYLVSAAAYKAIYPYLEPQVVKYDENNQRNIPALLTRSQAGWDSLARLFNGKQELTPVLFMAVMNWILAVCYLHMLGTVHRDLSVGNVIVFGPGAMAQLIDMGDTTLLPPENELTEEFSISTYPDFSAGTNYDQKSDAFSLAMNLLAAYVIPRCLNKKVNKLTQETHKDFNDRIHQIIRINHFKGIHTDVQQISPPDGWEALFPHLLALTDPDRSERPSLNSVFLDPTISRKIQDHINQIAGERPSHFISINNLSLSNAIEQLTANKDDHCNSGTTVMMLLAYALHCNDIPEKIRINFICHIERMFLDMQVSPITIKLLYHYERVFPRLLTQTLTQKISLNVIRPTDNLFFLEILTNQVAFETIGIIASELTEGAIAHESEKVRIINQVFFKTTHIIVDGLIEEAIDDKNQKDELITTTINGLLLNVWSHIDKQQARARAQQQLACILTIGLLTTLFVAFILPRMTGNAQKNRFSFNAHNHTNHSDMSSFTCPRP